MEIAAEQIAGNNSSQELLDMEQDEYTALRPYPCDFCSRRFRKKASLNNHMLAHQNDRPHLCKLCGARFSRRAELISHFKAHAEAQVAADAAAAIKFEPQQQQRQMDDHFYEQEWPLYQEQEEDQVQQQLQQMEEEQQEQEQLVMPQASYAAISEVPAPTATRGRISRLKPKEESTPYIVIAEKQTTDDLQQYMECEELPPTLTSSTSIDASHAAVSVPVADAPQAQRFPVIDDSKPFVCQQCGLAFAREKALVSHIKVTLFINPSNLLLYYTWFHFRIIALTLHSNAISVKICSGTITACRNIRRHISSRRAIRSMIRLRLARIAPVNRNQSNYMVTSTVASAAFHFTGRTCCVAMPSNSTSSSPRMSRTSLATLMPRMPKMRSIVVIHAANRFPALWNYSPMPRCMHVSRLSSEWSTTIRSSIICTYGIRFQMRFVWC